MMKRYFYFVAILWAFTTTADAQTTLQHTPKGALYTIFTQNTGDKIKLNDVITLQITQKTDKDSLLSSTYSLGHPVQVKVEPSQSVTDMMEIFPLLTAKDSVLVKIPADSVFKGQEDKRPPFFPKGSYFNFYLKVVKVQTLDEAIADRNAQIQKVKTDEIISANKYIADNKLVVKTTLSGLKYIITKPALKPKPQNGDTVLVNYTGKLLNGQVFDSSIAAVAEKSGLRQDGRNYEPIKLVLGHGDVIKGWDEGLALLNEGAKGTLIIPSTLAYGEQGSGPIPPYSTLVFDVELVKVIRVPHAIIPKKPLGKKHYPMVKKKS